jgi:hypothetical protein
MRIYLVKRAEDNQQFLVKALNQADALAVITKQSYEVKPVKPVELHSMLALGFKVIE